MRLDRQHGILDLLWASPAAAEAGIWEYVADAETYLLSAASARLHGVQLPPGNELPPPLSAAELRAQIHPEDRGVFEAATFTASSDGTSRSFQYRARIADQPGEYQWVHCFSRLVPGRDGLGTRLLGLHFEGTVQHSLEMELEDRSAALRLCRERLHHAFDAGRDGVFDTDMATGSVIVSPSWARHLGYADPPTSLAFWFNVTHPDDRALFAEERRAFFAGEVQLSHHEQRQLRADGTSMWVRMRVKQVGPGFPGYPHRVMGTVVDITARKEAELRIARIASHDPLTELPNRGSFQQRLKQAIEAGPPRQGVCAVLVCDLDRFKAVNDTRGHMAGDSVLKVAALRFRQILAGEHFVARLSGDEFAAIVQTANLDALNELCAHLVAALAEPFCIQQGTLLLGVSIGVAVLAADGADADEIFKRADIALHAAKSEGHAQYRFYEVAHHIRRQERSSLALDLKEALRRKELELLYQPVISLKTGSISSVEALLHWNHPVRGTICPRELLLLAEETGTVADIGRWALETACLEAAAWPEPARIAVNVSPRQLDGSLKETVLVALVKSGLPPARLKLEIAENALMEDVESRICILDGLQKLGVRIVLDDFGKAFCGLSHIRRFPFDKIKIDRSFVRDIGEPDVSAIMRAVISIGERLGIGVVAEGVESANQLRLVRYEGCEDVQGSFLSPALNEVDLRALLASGTSAKWQQSEPAAEPAPTAGSGVMA